MHATPTLTPIERPRRRRLWRVARALVAVLVVALAAAVAWLVPGSGYASAPYRVWGPRAAIKPAAWTRPCWHRNTPPYHGWWMNRCARAAGRVVYRQSHDPDGDADVHLVVVAGRHLVNLKIPGGAGRPGLPGFGAHVVAVGPLSRDHHGLPELRVVTLRR